MDDTEQIRWRRDASNSRLVRVLWAFGVGTFFATGAIIIFWRFFDVAGQASSVPAQEIVAAAAAGLVVTALAVGLTGRADRYMERAGDVIVGTIVVAGVMGSLMIVGRVVSQRELLAVGAGPFTGLAALLIPLALVALALAVFLRSVGTLDPNEETVYLHDPDQAIDLELITDVSIRQLGDTAIVTLEYAQPDGQYVQGPRRLVVPPSVAQKVRTIVRS